MSQPRRARVTARALVLARLAGRDIRQHAAQAVLLVIAITAATATLTMALALNGGTAHPYAATRAATRGPDVVAYLPAAAQAGPLTGAAGVTAHSGPYPVASAALRFRGRSAAVFAEGRAAGPTAVDQPRLTGSQWVRPGGIVVERTFGEALGVAPRAAGGGIPAPRPRAAGAMPSGIPPAAEDAMPPG